MNLDIYIVGIFVILALIIKVLPIKKEKNKLFINISFIILFTILILRKPYSDMIKYLDVFKKMNFESFPELLNLRWEKLYLVLNLFISIFTNSERVFIIIISILGLVGPYLFIKRYSKDYLFSVIFFIILGLYNYNFYIIRQALAISVLLIGVRFIEEKSLWKFLLTVLIASCLHVSSIIFVIAYPICNVKINIKGIIAYILTAICIFFTSDMIISLMYKLSIYDMYANRGNATDGKGRLLLLIMIFAAMIVVNYINHREELKKTEFFCKRNKEDTNSLFLNMFMIGIIFQLFAIRQSVIVRLANIFIISASILIPNVISEIDNKKFKKLCYIAILLCTIGYAFFIPTINNYEIYLM